MGMAFLQELEAESAATRKCLERVPVNLFDWKPHPKSMLMGYLSHLVAEIPLWVKHMVVSPEIDFVRFEHYHAASTEDLVAFFDRNMDEAREALKTTNDKDLEGPFNLKADGKLVMTLPRNVNIGQSINHLVHHRGQLTVYLRLNDIPVPSLYGPSADDRGF
ncbi:MAG TPA: DinB family protein [Spirochaetia bacterium]